MMQRLAPILRRARGWGWRKASNTVRRFVDKLRPTYSQTSYPGRLGNLIRECLDVAPIPDELVQHYLQHHCDLLGSGWVHVSYGMRCRGLEGYLYEMGVQAWVDPEGHWLRERINKDNLSEAQRVWKLVDRGYDPIDWQLDFKSGYRWREDAWYRDIRFGHKPGVDIKVPWELSRMQHLPQLAIAYGDWVRTRKSAERLSREFRNQVLDFVATNPPHFGVNWACAMDVAIRVSNWLVAYDLFRSAEAVFDGEFESVFCRSVYEHAKHIVENLEWYEGVRGNHYLANIVGLLFAAAHLTRTSKTDAWLAFAVQELVKEVAHQFHVDGTNFEGSTAYHRLAAEMVVYATALTLGLPDDKRDALQDYDHRLMRGRPALRPAPVQLYEIPRWGARSTTSVSPFPSWYFERIERMAEFVTDITKPDGHIPQIGDNDSGRFLKLAPVFRRLTVRMGREEYMNLGEYSDLPDDADYWMEDHLDARHVVAAVAGLMERPDFKMGFTHCAGMDQNERALRHADTQIIGELARSCCVSSQQISRHTSGQKQVVVGSEADFAALREEIAGVSPERTKVTKFPLPGCDLCRELMVHAYPDFGLFLFRSPQLYLAVRCWSAGSKRLTSHFHNDQLTIELAVNAKNLIVDPGTYLYSASAEQRNRYRSVHSHFTPWMMREEPARLDQGLFQLPNPLAAQVRYFGPDGFAALMGAGMSRAIRLILLETEAVTILDCMPDAAPSRFGIVSEVQVPRTAGYGIRFQRVA